MLSLASALAGSCILTAFLQQLHWFLASNTSKSYALHSVRMALLRSPSHELSITPLWHPLCPSHSQHPWCHSPLTRPLPGRIPCHPPLQHWTRVSRRAGNGQSCLSMEVRRVLLSFTWSCRVADTSSFSLLVLWQASQPPAKRPRTTTANTLKSPSPSPLFFLDPVNTLLLGCNHP
jgi:hypothetical protein